MEDSANAKKLSFRDASILGVINKCNIEQNTDEVRKYILK